MKVRCPACLSRCDAKEKHKNWLAPCPKCRMKLLIPGVLGRDDETEFVGQQFLKAILCEVRSCSNCSKKYETSEVLHGEVPICPSCQSKSIEEEKAFDSKNGVCLRDVSLTINVPISDAATTENVANGENCLSSNAEQETYGTELQARNSEVQALSTSLSNDLPVSDAMQEGERTPSANFLEETSKAIRELNIDPALIRLTPSRSGKTKKQKKNGPIFVKLEGVFERLNEQKKTKPSVGPTSNQTDPPWDAKEDSAPSRKVFSRSPFQCGCGHSIDPMEFRIGDKARCPICHNEFVFRTAADDFWVVLPGLSPEEYEFHAIQVLEYAKLLFHSPQLLNSAIRDIRRTLMGIKQFAMEATTNESSIENDAAVSLFLSRYRTAKEKGIAPSQFLAKVPCDTPTMSSSQGATSKFIDEILREFKELVSHRNS